MLGGDRGTTTTYDVVVIGAGVAGLSAALGLGRSRRRTLLLDGGETRAGSAEPAYGFLSGDGLPWPELVGRGRRELARYDVERCTERAVGAARRDGAFVVTLPGGRAVAARRLVLATGVVDVLPDRPGLAELWGRGVYRSPYDRGWDLRDRPVAVLADGAAIDERVQLVRSWSTDLVALTDGAPVSDDVRSRLSSWCVPLHQETIARFVPADGADGLARIGFEDGRSLAREAAFFAPPYRQRSPLAESLGCELRTIGPAAELVDVDPLSRQTSVPGVYAVGDMSDPVHRISQAVAAGAAAAVAVHDALSADDADAVARSAPHR